jgi:hypothetical protein
MDATEATSFDPFTHVYIFDIGFPPNVVNKISTIFNNSSTSYLVCYHNAHLIVDEYKFDVQPIQEKVNPSQAKPFIATFISGIEWWLKTKLLLIQRSKMLCSTLKWDWIIYIKLQEKECYNINGKCIVGLRSCTIFKLK